jgi:hypothetical protein
MLRTGLFPKFCRRGSWENFKVPFEGSELTGL